MLIRLVQPHDRAALPDIWLQSARATHTFLTEDAIQALLPAVREYLHSDGPELWVLVTEAGVIAGFMGLAESKIDALFLAPEHQRQGHGRRLVQHAIALKGELAVDVNEQNPGACQFYEACGFVPVGRSEVDDAGRPYPLVHMRLAESAVRT
jgi:putative acetyltransferase